MRRQVAKEALVKIMSIMNLDDNETIKKEIELKNIFPDVNRIDIDENGKLVVHYSFDNHYGARITKNEDDEWTIVTVRKTSKSSIGDCGPAIELDSWIITGNLDVIKSRLEQIEKYKF